ncbi:protein kinase domain-containing protein [Sideroxyarcus sp. TK5]
MEGRGLQVPNIQIEENRLRINGEQFSSHSIEREIGRGANGIVYLANNHILKRQEVVKIWCASNPKDSRDKKSQAFAEAAKLANAHPEHAVQIFSAGLVGGIPYATMEYVDGKTLKQKLDETRDKKLLLGLAGIYLTAIEETSQANTFHGDPHWSNVLVYEHQPNKYETSIKVKLCDFGTSIFSGHERSEDRHWRLVEECVLNTTKSFKSFQEAKTELPRFKSQLSEFTSQSKPDFLDDLHWAKLHTAPLRDFLDYLSVELGHA